jgi:hypothetical protein
MIEFTISLNEPDLEFEPASNAPGLALVLPTTARIGRDDDVIHLAPVPVHCCFNGFTFGHWLAQNHGLSDADSFVVYMLHDMFKPLLTLTSGSRGKSWPHAFDCFDHLCGGLNGLMLDDPKRTFYMVRNHHQSGIGWREAVRHEGSLDAATEAPGHNYSWDWPMIGLAIRLQSALSNALSIAYIKRLFVESYTEAMQTEYPDVFARYEAVSYQYDFVDPATLAGDVNKDIETLCRQSRVHLDGRNLVIRTFIGATGTHWQPNQQTSIRLPFWLLLTLREDPVSILFPAPTLYGKDGKPADNPAFVDRVRDGFYQRVRELLTSVPVSETRKPKWNARVDEIMFALDETFHIVHTKSFDDATDARRVDGSTATEICSMCGSPIPASFACSPVADLGANVSNYTDWHLGDADHACVLCAISHFKTPAALEPAKDLIFQRKLVYLATSTPSARPADLSPATLPFFMAKGFKPRLEIRSLESLVTLNVIAALYLHDTIRRAVHYHDGERDLWLEKTFPTGPFSFVGEVAKAKNKVGMPDFLETLFENLNRPITLLDPLLPMQVEVPFHALACLWGVSKGRHYQFKYKPLMVSNETATLPVIWEGYHFIDRSTLDAIKALRTLVETFRHPKVDHHMKLTALASGPEEFIETLVQLGGYNYETVLERLGRLSGGSDVTDYLKRLRELIVQTPLITEIWR